MCNEIQVYPLRSMMNRILFVLFLFIINGPVWAKEKEGIRTLEINDIIITWAENDYKPVSDSCLIINTNDASLRKIYMAESCDIFSLSGKVLADECKSEQNAKRVIIQSQFTRAVFKIDSETCNSLSINMLKKLKYTQLQDMDDVYLIQAYASESEPQQRYKKCSDNILSLYKLEDTYFLLSDFTTYENAKSIVRMLNAKCDVDSWIRPPSMPLDIQKTDLTY